MDTFIARVQAALTFLIVGAWVVLMGAWTLGLEGAGNAVEGMKEIVTLATTFWLMRSRQPAANDGAGNGVGPAPDSRATPGAAGASGDRA